MMNIDKFIQLLGVKKSATVTTLGTEEESAIDGGIRKSGDISIVSVPAPLPSLEVIKKCLSDACSDFYRKTTGPVSDAAEGSIYRLDSLEILETPANMHLLEALIPLDAPIRKRMALNCIGKAQGEKLINRTRFFGMSVQRDSKLISGEVVQVHASEGGQRVPFTVVFNGAWEFEEKRMTPLRVISSANVKGAKSQELLKLTIMNSGEDDLVSSLGVVDFPIKIGASKELTLRVGGQWVSGEHLLFELTPSSPNSRPTVLVTDLSKNGTWMNGAQLENGKPTPLSTGATLLLGSPNPGVGIPAVKIVYSEKSAPNQPPTSKPAEQAASAPPLAMTNLTVRPNIRPQTTETAMSSVSAVKSTLPVLRERRPDGTEFVHVISQFPFEIGREPTLKGSVKIDDSFDFVSRVHLRIEALHGGSSLAVTNLASNRRGTWSNGQQQDEAFIWEPSRRFGDDSTRQRPSVSSSGGGWLTLGAPIADDHTVQIRLELASVTSAEQISRQLLASRETAMASHGQGWDDLVLRAPHEA
jgi:FHA domain